MTHDEMIAVIQDDENGIPEVISRAVVEAVKEE